eukprot:m51a1_g9457 hypothetical protein (135) ;mRNA; f:510711-511670
MSSSPTSKRSAPGSTAPSENAESGNRAERKEECAQEKQTPKKTEQEIRDEQRRAQIEAQKARSNPYKSLLGRKRPKDEGAKKDQGQPELKKARSEGTEGHATLDPNASAYLEEMRKFKSQDCGEQTEHVRPLVK